MSRPEFLASLELKVRLLDLASVEHRSFGRALELINKTNQFNTNGRRWTQKELQDGFARGLGLLAFEVDDRFSRYGLVGVALVEKNEIVQFVMSCRVLGLDVERAVLGELLRRLGARGERSVSARIVETEANRPCRDVYARAGFVLDGERWIATELAPPPVSHVELQS